MLQVPTVTQDDLNEYHVRVFGSVAPSMHLRSLDPDNPHEGTSSAIAGEEEDDLGYYPDGAKRTLTDHQIAMFRHSEIYAILRERQVRKENREAGENGEIPGPDLDRPAKSNPAQLPMPEIRAEDVVDDQGKYDSTRSASPQSHQKSMELNSKRKRHGADDGGRSHTSRRLARELDSAPAEDCVLDYGDELTEQEIRTPTHFVMHSPDKNEHAREEIAAVQGRKIWWPVIQAT